MEATNLINRYRRGERAGYLHGLRITHERLMYRDTILAHRLDDGRMVLNLTIYNSVIAKYQDILKTLFPHAIRVYNVPMGTWDLSKGGFVK